MTLRTPVQAFAEVAASPAEHDDVADTLLRLWPGAPTSSAST